MAIHNQTAKCLIQINIYSFAQTFARGRNLAHQLLSETL